MGARSARQLSARSRRSNLPRCGAVAAGGRREVTTAACARSLRSLGGAGARPRGEGREARPESLGRFWSPGAASWLTAPRQADRLSGEEEGGACFSRNHLRPLTVGPLHDWPLLEIWNSGVGSYPCSYLQGGESLNGGSGLRQEGGPSGLPRHAPQTSILPKPASSPNPPPGTELGLRETAQHQAHRAFAWCFSLSGAAPSSVGLSWGGWA